MDDAVFWGVLSAAIFALIIAIVVLVVVTRERRRAAEYEAMMTIPLLDAFADAGDGAVRMRGTAYAGDSMVVEPISGEPVLWYRVDGMGHPVKVDTDGDVVYPFVIRRAGDIVVRDMMGAEARLDRAAGFIVPLDRFGRREFVVDDGFESMEYELTDEIREAVRPYVNSQADQISTLERLSLLPGTDVTVTGLVRRGDDGLWRLEGDDETPLVVSALDDEDDADHPRPTVVPGEEGSVEEESERSNGGAGTGAGAAAGVMATVGSSRTARRVPGVSQARRYSRTGSQMRSGGAGGAGRRATQMGRRHTQRLGGGAGGGRSPGVGQVRRYARMGRGGGGVKNLARRGPGGRQLSRVSRLKSGGGMRSMGGGSGLRRLTRLGRGGSMSRMRPPVRPPRVG